MRADTFDILRCPFCGGRLELVAGSWHRLEANQIQDGIIGCQCCTFPVVAGIPVLHLNDSAKTAAAHVEAARPDLAWRTMLDFGDGDVERFERVVSSPTATYRDAIGALPLDLEGGYFLYRFSDPSYVVADALVRAVAGTTLSGGGRAIDMCGGTGHLTRALMDLSSPPPVLADLYFSKMWLARRFTAPGCEAVCCDANAPLPFARGAFRYAMCADAFMFIWMKRQLVGELCRLVDDGTRGGAVVISHTHNELQWSPSHGQPLSPDGYRDLFETVEPRLFAEAGLLADVVAGGPLDLARRDAADVLDQDPALVVVATENDDVWRLHPIDASTGTAGVLRINPLYVVESQPDAPEVRLRLQFPSEHYADEFGACRAYLPDAISVDRRALAALESGRRPRELVDLVRRRVILDLPVNYY